MTSLAEVSVESLSSDSDWGAIESRLSRLEEGIRALRALPWAQGPAASFDSSPALILPLVCSAGFMPPSTAVTSPVSFPIPEGVMPVPDEAELEDPRAAVFAKRSEAPNTGADEGIHLLREAAGALQPGPLLSSAAEDFLRVYREGKSNFERANAITHCGIAMWHATLAFFRTGARSILKNSLSGEPEEIFLILLLKPAEFSGGATGSRLRGAVRLDAMSRLHECLKTAMFCFQKAVELGSPALGLQWQINVQRGTGNFEECRRLATQAESIFDIHERAQAATVLKGIEKYRTDLKMLGVTSCESHLASSDWVNPAVLDSMTAVCSMLRKDRPASLAGA